MARRALLVVDMSVEQVASLSHRKASVIGSIAELARLDCWALKLDSRLWLRTTEESTLSAVNPEWGDTMGVPGSEGAALIPELRECGLQFVEKKHYSSFVDSPLLDLLSAARVDELVLTGINTDYCIFATAMDSFARGRLRTLVVEEAVGSISGAAGHRQGLAWTRAHLGGGSVVPISAFCT